MWRKLGTLLLGTILLIVMGCGNMDQPTKANDAKSNGSGNVSITLDINKESQAVNFVITLVNQMDQALTLTFMSGKQYEIKVYDQNNQLVYNSSDGKMYTQAINEVTLKPGESKQWTDVWKGKLVEGKYKVVATITASEVTPNTVKLNDFVVEKTFEQN